MSSAEIFDNATAIYATDLPVSADLGDGFGPDPEACADTARADCARGLVGGSIEDATDDPAASVYDFARAVARVAAAAEATRDLPFLLTARAESHLFGSADLTETVRRLQAFSQAGAHILYAPGLPDLQANKVV